jgi:hypothetical protein
MKIGEKNGSTLVATSARAVILGFRKTKPETLRLAILLCLLRYGTPFL